MEDTLGDLGLAEKPRLLVLNKLDLVVAADPDEPSSRPSLEGLGVEGIMVSAGQGWGLDLVLQAIEERLGGGLVRAQAGQSEVFFIE